LFRVAQYFVGFGDFSKPSSGVGVAVVSIGMELQRERAKSSLYVIAGSISAHPKNVVIVLSGHLRLLGCLGRSVLSGLTRFY